MKCLSFLPHMKHFSIQMLRNIFQAVFSNFCVILTCSTKGNNLCSFSTDVRHLMLYPLDGFIYCLHCIRELLTSFLKRLFEGSCVPKLRWKFLLHYVLQKEEASYSVRVLGLVSSLQKSEPLTY